MVRCCREQYYGVLILWWMFVGAHLCADVTCWWCGGVVVQCCSGVVEWWCGGVVVQYCSGVAVQIR